MCGKNLPVFWRNWLPPSSTIKMAGAGYSEILVNFYQKTQHHIPEDSSLFF
jgi:hypothetical protein